MKLKDIQMVVSDLDGTLLRDDHSISAYTIGVCTQLHEKGLRFVPATGRPYSAMKHNVPLPLCNDIICTNGVHIYSRVNERDFSLVQELNLDWATAYEIIKLKEASFAHLHMHLYQGEELYSRQSNRHSDEYTERTGLQYTFLEDWKEITQKGVSKFMFISFYQDELLALTQELKKIPSISVAFSSANYLEVFSERASKGAALLFLMEKHGLSADQVLVLGDSYNDSTMLELASHAYVMKNADADFCPDLPRSKYDNNGDGAAQLIESLLL